MPCCRFISENAWCTLLVQYIAQGLSTSFFLLVFLGLVDGFFGVVCLFWFWFFVGVLFGQDFFILLRVGLFVLIILKLICISKDRAGNLNEPQC